ncbi:MAG: hypothetical protein WAK29_03365 [Terriglobales bacterium]
MAPNRLRLDPDQLAGIEEKLERADENILNLGVEINAFVKGSPDPSTAEPKGNRTQQWINFHKYRDIPPRFGVLAGEIVHHWRSCLDHIAWGLSSDDYRRDHETAIAFPILLKPPNERGQARYNGNVEGITNTAALKLIEDLQPHKRSNPADDPLAIIHELDRVDKHHTLVLVVPDFDAQLIIPKRLTLGRVIGAFVADDDPLPAEPADSGKLQISRQIAFAEFGQRKNQAVVPSLTHLSHEVRDIFRRFSEL